MPGATTADHEPLSAEDALLRSAIDLPAPKFSAPTPRRESVRRAELLARLEDRRAGALILLTAPAGYGKTTLLTQWTEESGRPFAWVILDELDGEPRALAESIAGAVARIGIEAGLGRSFVLVLDDAQVVPPDVLRDAVLDVLRWLPNGSQLAVASRCEPALALGRMRAEGTLLEIRAEDLSMSAVEAAALLRTTGIELDFDSVQSVAGRTEGWPAALALTAISCGRRHGPAEQLGQLNGDAYPMSEYFRAELLAGLSPSAIRFLTRSSVLDRLSGPACDDVLDRRGSAALLAELARTNVPLQPVDACHERYRLHGLFRDMLHAELRRVEPERYLELHRRAGEWYRRAGDLDRAIDHAHSAGDLDRTGELLWPNLPGYLGEGRNLTVQRWLDGVTPEQTTNRAPLALASAHSNLALGRLTVAEQWARSAGVSLSESAEADTKRELAGVLLIEAWAARSGATRMRDAAERAYDLLSDDSPWRATCCFLRGTAALLIGDEAEAERRLEEGAARGATLALDAASLCLAQLAVLAAERDQTDYASDFARRARALVDEHQLGGYPICALVSAVCAAAAMREGRVDEAKADVSHCLGLLASLDESVSWYGAEARILLARVSLALGDVAGARELLADASRHARRTREVVVFGRWFDDAWNEFDVRAEAALAGIAALTKAELRVLRFLPTHYSFQEIAQRLHVSSNTVKTHVHAVYRKLDASSRSEAVMHATDAGLLG